MPVNPPPARPRRAVYSVAQTAALCGMSRGRFYDLIRDGVMPHPVYCTRTRRPMYLADQAALCQRVRETGTAIDGRFVIFYDRSGGEAPAAGRTTRPSRAPSAPAPSDPLVREMAETLVAMGVRAGAQEIDTAIRGRCPQGVREETFEADLRAVFDALRCRETDR